MSTLPQNTILGNLEIHEVFEYYDQPLLFVCRNTSDTLYLVVLSDEIEDENDEINIWLYVSISRERYIHIRSGHISLYDAFKNSEEGFVLEVSENINIQQYEVKVVQSTELHSERLPMQDQYLNYDTQSLPSSEERIDRKASQTNREYIELALHFPQLNRNEAPIITLSNLMGNLQKTLYSLGHSISPFYKESKTTTKDLRGEMELLLVDIRAGSFKLEMASSTNTNMFGQGLVGDVMEEFAKLIKVGADSHQLQELFSTYKTTVPKAYVKFLNSIKKSRIDKTDLRWASPQKKIREVILYSSIVYDTIDTINQMVEKDINLFSITGKLTGTYVNRNFEITNGEDVYEGTIDAEQMSIDAINIIGTAQIQGRYTVKIREEIIRRVGTDITSRDYYLIDIEIPNSDNV